MRLVLAEVSFVTKSVMYVKFNSAPLKSAEGQGRPVSTSGQHLDRIPACRDVQQSTSQTCTCDQERTIPVPLGFRHVLPPGFLHPFAHTIVDPPPDPRRHADHHTPNWHVRSLGDDNAR